MTADPEAVTRALASYGIDPEDAADIAADLADLPVDRLAEAEAKVQRVEAKLEEWGHDPECESLTCFKGDGSTREPADCDCYYAEFRAALSGGDAT